MKPSPLIQGRFNVFHRNVKRKPIPIRVNTHKETVVVEKRGKLLALARYNNHRPIPPGITRGQIREFSRASRLRLLKFFATVAWGKIPMTLFITLTYPDSCDWSDANERRKHKYLFHRYMEKHLGRKVSGVWRLEWKVRRSGANKGMFVPHFHLLVFGVGFIQWKRIRHWWRKVLGWEGKIATDVQGCKSGKKASIYVSKYVAKMPVDDSLDNGAYRNKPGRAWGYFRKALIPRETALILNGLNGDEIEWLCGRANEVLAWRLPDDENGFVVLGDMADYLYSEFEAFRVANRITS